MSLDFINYADSYFYPRQLTDLSYIFSFDCGKNNLGVSFIKTHIVDETQTLPNNLNSFFLRIRTYITVYSLLLYGIALIVWQKISTLPWIGKYLQDDYSNWLIQGTIASFFPTYTPMIFFSIYYFAYRLEMLFVSLYFDRTLKSSTICLIQKLRRAPLKSARLIGRVSAMGFMGGTPKMPGGGGPQGMLVWGCVIITGVAINQYRLHRYDVMNAANESDRIKVDYEKELNRMKMDTQREAERIRADAINKAYQTQTEALNKKPWWGKEPPQPPKF